MNPLRPDELALPHNGAYGAGGGGGFGAGRSDAAALAASELVEQEALAGFDLAPDRAVFASARAAAAAARLRRWLARREIEVVEEDGARIKWAEVHVVVMAVWRVIRIRPLFTTTM